MSRYIDVDTIEYHEIFDGHEFVRVVYGDDIDEMPTADVVPSKYGCGNAPYCSDVWEVDEDE